MREFWQISYLFAPLLLGLTAHGVCIRFGWLRFLYKAVDGGALIGGKPVFGANKTYRGIAAMTLGAALGFALQALWLHNYESVRWLELFEYTPAKAIITGTLVGLAAALSELPNSFIKRRLDIAPGQTGLGPVNLLFYILDQADFLVGAWIVLAFVIEVTAWRVLYSFIFLFVTHQVISFLGYLLGMRKTAR